MRYLYLHGFASGTASHKAGWFGAALARHGARLEVPDLNGGDFPHLTLSRQAAVVAQVLGDDPAPVTLIGSSFGGYLAAVVAEREPRVARLVLLAPAFGFDALLAQALGPERLSRWRAEGRLRLPPEVDGEERWLHYDVVADLAGHAPGSLRRRLPACLFHGIDDATVPYAESIAYLKRNPDASLLLLNDVHSLTESLPAIWRHTAAFCGLAPGA